MVSRKSLLLPAILVLAPMAGLPASAATCSSGTTAIYEAPGFSCNVGSVLFSDFAFVTTGSASITNVAPVTFDYNGTTEYGLRLGFTSVASGADAVSDVLWTYNVSALPGSLVDAYASLAGTSQDNGHITLSEVLSNGVTLSLNQAGIAYETFPAISALHVIKNQLNFVGAGGGFAQTSAIENAFSVSPVPLPGAALLLGSVLAGLSGFGAMRRRGAAVS